MSSSLRLVKSCAARLLPWINTCTLQCTSGLDATDPARIRRDMRIQTVESRTFHFQDAYLVPEMGSTDLCRPSQKRWMDCACGSLAWKLQSRCGTYSTLSIRACSIRIPRSGSAAMVQSRNQSF
ncbi:hypothetical protein Y032_0032g2576 [Ancylostoma ceylanicum]|uniref:Uncharacterized protein n=1 Tax=Ancylostoma ceylanicum TaxID=53326 RepID=A0A016UP23_9BILA|nr:hypothetical protein Y032_0032g2576 [Ancylostoma ceylanicum]